MTRLVTAARRSFQVAGAFFRIGLQQDLSYPLGFATSQLSSLLPVFIFYFVAHQFARPGYFSFVLIGLIATRLLDAGVRGFSTEMDVAINRGWLEMFLVEPLRWRLLPISMVQWRAMQGLVNALLMSLLGIAFGARFTWSGIPVALVIGGLGLIAGLAIGTLSASLKVLAKSGDPIIFLYGLAAQIFGGVYFEVETLPDAIQWVSWLIPHTYVIAALRHALTPGQAAGTIAPGTAVIALAGFCVVVFPLSLWLYGRALEYGRKLGVLGGY